MTAVLYTLGGLCGVAAVVWSYTTVCLAAAARGLSGWRVGLWGGIRRLRARRLHMEEPDWPCVYVHFALGLWPVYVGQSIDHRARMRSEAKEIMSLVFTHTIAIPVPAADLDDVERGLIRAFRCRTTGFNLTGGNT